MKKLTILSLMLFYMLFLSCSFIPNNKLKKQTIKKFSIEKYTGVWYEAARFNHSMEKGLTGVSATYSLNNDGTIKVMNQGFKDSLTGKRSYIEGFAKMPDKNNMGFLKVYFSKWFGAPYLVLELDTVNYQYALVGSTFKNFLWILSRQKQMPKEHYDICIKKAQSLGYDTSKLIKVLQ